MSSTNPTLSYIAKLQYISGQLSLYMSIIILVFGLIGNLLNCLVFAQRSLRSKPCVVYFLVASILNLIIIFSGIAPRAFQIFFMIPDQTETVSTLCKLRLVVLFTMRTISSWLLTLASVDRYLISSSNVNRRRMSNLKNAYISILIVSIISALVWAEAGYCFDANLVGTPQKCYAKSNACRVYNDLAQSLITTIIPSAIILIIGLLTINNVRQVQRIGPSSISMTNNKNTQRNRKDERSLTIMLFAQVILLTIFTLPQAGQKFYLTYTFYQTKSSIQRALEKCDDCDQLLYLDKNIEQLKFFAGIDPQKNYTMSQRKNRRALADSKPATNNDSTDTTVVVAGTSQRSACGALVSSTTEPSVIPKPTRASPSGTERSCSAFPILNESMRNLSIDAASALAKDSRSQSVRPVIRRRILCSAVPESAELTPIRRPDEGGSKGQKISVYTNHFRVQIPDAIIYQYDIEIVMIGRDGKARLTRKDDRWEVIQTFVKQRNNFPTIWYDEGKTLYSREILPDLKLPIQIEIGKDDEKKTFQLKKLVLVRQDKIQNIHDFIEKKINMRPREAVRIIEILFKQRARNDLIAIRNQFYDRRRQLDDLGDGRGMARGFYQALFLTQMGPTLNINLTFTCFFMPLNFVDFACKYLRKDITKGLNENDLKVFEKIVRNLSIETMHTGRRIFYRIRGFGRPANRLMFRRGGDDGQTASAVDIKETSVADYFAEKYRKLMYPYLPCINAMKGAENKPNWLPMEFVRIVEWQRALKPLDKQQRGVVSRNTIIKPEQRYNEIMKIVRNNQFDRDPYLKELNIHVDDKEMLEIKARVLAPPKIRYRSRGQGEVIESVNCGKWRIQNWFYTTSKINSWGMIYFGDTPNSRIEDTLSEFQNRLPDLLRRSGFVINTELLLTIKSSLDNEIYNTLLDASRQRWQLAIIIINSRNSEIVYNLVKKYANTKIGLMTQCVNFQALERNMSKLEMYVENISQKINGKLGNINGVINIKSALSRSSREDLFMFFGADVTHSTCSSDYPSISAVVGSRDLTNNLYAARVCEQYPKKGRCSLEIIKELDTMVIDLLRVFANSCGDRLPNKIIFYRDGVDEGQYQKVLDNEVNKIKNACRIVYGNKPLPQLAFIVVKKRHNTRFFLYDGNETMNVQAGTVIDQSIIHPSQFDFYLCSQAAIMGTSRPALYHVLHDDIGFSSDDIQQLTYWLCHTDMRCTKSVSIPAPVHYAHLAAYASRALKYGEDQDRESVDENNEEPETYSLDDIKTKVMVLDEKITDDMWFI
ncbi:unnamed protein product [Rotaria sp. Silwood1]|nr:unnamed protein product [Rotaria sp. Silwood1]CAF3498942.1 unnamed protein product [Rotaria sp. Silwood1]CAF4857323.1 unnamed protein product [Rotaria sp. Silwood1]